MKEDVFSIKGVLVWSICTLFFLYEFLLRTIVGTFQQPIMLDLKLSNVEFSIISSSAFLLVYGFMQVPVGVIIDNIGLKKSLIIANLLCMVSCAGFAVSGSLLIAICFRVLMAFGASFGFVAMIISINDWLPQKRKALFIGISQFIGTLGPIIAAGPLHNMAASGIDSGFWRLVFFALAVISGGIFLLTLFFVENRLDVAGKYVILYRPEKSSKKLKNTLNKNQVWFIAILSALLYFVLEYIAENEGRGFLVSQNISGHQAGYIISIGWLGYAIACPALGYISDLIERRKNILIFSGFIGVVAIAIILFLPNNAFLLYIAFFLLGVNAGGQTIGFAIMSEQLKQKYVAVGIGLNNGCIAFISAINAPLIALFIADGNNESAISPEGYLLMFKILLAIAVIALAISIFFIKETFCKSVAQPTLLTVP